MKILWSPLAIDRASEIAEYISQDNPDAAENWINTVFEKVEHLKEFPESGRIVPETDNMTIRKLIRSVLLITMYLQIVGYQWAGFAKISGTKSN